MKVRYIELLGRKYPMCFSLSAIARLEEEFGGMEEMLEALTYKPELGLSAVIEASETVLGIFMDAGRKYAAAMGEEVPPPLPCRVMDVMGAELLSAKALIGDVIDAGSGREVEAEAKNAGAAPPLPPAARPGSSSPEPKPD